MVARIRDLGFHSTNGSHYTGVARWNLARTTYLVFTKLMTRTHAGGFLELYGSHILYGISLEQWLALKIWISQLRWLALQGLVFNDDNGSHLCYGIHCLVWLALTILYFTKMKACTDGMGFTTRRMARTWSWYSCGGWLAL